MEDDCLDSRMLSNAPVGKYIRKAKSETVILLSLLLLLFTGNALLK
jgi:hypothetical protein